MFLYNFVKKYHITKRLFITYFTGLMVILYFIFCTVFGQKGLIEYVSLKNKVAGKEEVKKELSSEVQVKKNMVDGMNSNSLDVDLLDEQARRVLGYAGKNEVVIYQDQKSSTSK